MKRQRGKYVIMGGLLCIAIWGIVACGQRQDRQDEWVTKVAKLEAKINTLEEQQQLLVSVINQLEEQLNMKDGSSQTLKAIEEKIKENQQECWKDLRERNTNLEKQIDVLEALVNQKDLFVVYTADGYTGEAMMEEAIEINTQLGLKEQLQILMDELSEKGFEELPITVEKVEQIEGKKIAIVNLQELEGRSVQEVLDLHEKRRCIKCWAQDYFQGSAGSSVTLGKIDKTLLQPTYEGNWIDGYKLLYNGQDKEGWGHVEVIGQIRYRDDK
nr:hypothetical protein [uncultured Niameybacter sp.]